MKTSKFTERNDDAGKTISPASDWKGKRIDPSGAKRRQNRASNSPGADSDEENPCSDVNILADSLKE